MYFIIFLNSSMYMRYMQKKLFGNSQVDNES